MRTRFLGATQGQESHSRGRMIARIGAVLLGLWCLRGPAPVQADGVARDRGPEAARATPMEAPASAPARPLTW
jgi:hypothetical protein